jgi:anti-sigma factor RsiW
MHKGPQRRYASVEALIRDVDHYLDGEPLEAGPDALRYRTGRFVRRNHRAVLSAALAFAVMIAMAKQLTRPAINFLQCRMMLRAKRPRRKSHMSKRIQLALAFVMGGITVANAVAVGPEKENNSKDPALLATICTRSYSRMSTCVRLTIV